jgi:putative restriction endonuclease
MADADELLGRPVVANGIALSKIHHAAFDNHLMGIDPDGRVHVFERLLMLHDGPLPEQSLKATAGALIRLPAVKQYHPDRDRLAARFEQFKRVA